MMSTEFSNVCEYNGFYMQYSNFIGTIIVWFLFTRSLTYTQLLREKKS